MYPALVGRLFTTEPPGQPQLQLYKYINKLHRIIFILGEGNGTPLQYSCLENPMDGGAWWAALYGVAESQTRLKRLTSKPILEAQAGIKIAR